MNELNMDIGKKYSIKAIMSDLHVEAVLVDKMKYTHGTYKPNHVFSLTKLISGNVNKWIESCHEVLQLEDKEYGDKTFYFPLEILEAYCEVSEVSEVI